MTFKASPFTPLPAETRFYPNTGSECIKQSAMLSSLLACSTCLPLDRYSTSLPVVGRWQPSSVCSASHWWYWCLASALTAWWAATTRAEVLFSTHWMAWTLLTSSAEAPSLHWLVPPELKPLQPKIWCGSPLALQFISLVWAVISSIYSLSRQILFTGIANTGHRLLFIPHKWDTV